MADAVVTVSTSDRDGRVVVAVAGEIDAHTAPEVRAALDEALAASAGETRIVADLTGVTFMDSTGLGVFVTTLKHVREKEGSLDVVVTSPRVLKVFTITGLDVLIPVHETLDGALAD